MRSARLTRWQIRWHLLIDFAKMELKALLSHKGNKYPSVPTAHTVHAEKSCHNMHLIKHIQYGKYSQHIPLYRLQCDWRLACFFTCAICNCVASLVNCTDAQGNDITLTNSGHFDKHFFQDNKTSTIRLWLIHTTCSCRHSILNVV